MTARHTIARRDCKASQIDSQAEGALFQTFGAEGRHVRVETDLLELSPLTIVEEASCFFWWVKGSAVAHREAG